MLNKDQTVDRIWLIRDQVKKAREERKKNEEIREALDKLLDEYIKESGLPPGYNSKEELLNDTLT
jgi:hypothetical protein